MNQYHNPGMEALNGFIFNAFFPKPIEFSLNGKEYRLDKLPDGWSWRNEDGDTQEDYGIEPFATAGECQQSAIWFQQDSKEAV